MASINIRPAGPSDVPALQELIPRSARALSAGFYTEPQAEAAIRYIFGVDSALIRDGTYFVAESGAGIHGCGGWSRRRTLYGGDQHKDTEDPLLDPATDAARIRAFFVAPEFARRGIGGQLMQACASAAYAAGFRQLELMATLPGVPLYAAFGFEPREDVIEQLPNGVAVPFVRMHRLLNDPSLRSNAEHGSTT
jgi:GNAT superfamily N-acetyltransferase